MGFSSDQVDAADDTQFLTIFGENIQRYFKNDAGITIRLIVIVCVAWSIYLVTCCKALSSFYMISKYI
jgi:hypothetical protein